MMDKEESEITQLEKVNSQIVNAKKTTGYVLCGIGVFVFAVTLLVAINAKNIFLFAVGLIETAVLVGAGILLIHHAKKEQKKPTENLRNRAKEAHAHKKHTERKNVKRTRKKR